MFLCKGRQRLLAQHAFAVKQDDTRLKGPSAIQFCLIRCIENFDQGYAPTETSRRPIVMIPMNTSSFVVWCPCVTPSTAQSARFVKNIFAKTPFVIEC